MAAPTLTTYKFIVYVGDINNPTRHEVVTLGRDIQRCEAAFAQRGWGSATTRPMTAAAMAVYFAMTRDGLFSGKFEDFESFYLSIEPDEEVTQFPTDAGAEPA